MNVSVVIPLYNKVRHIRRAINSVLAQTCQAFDLIVVDDGSTDEGGNVVREIRDPRLHLITQQNAGECGARNRGIQEASSELVAFLDADDEWLPGFLDTVMGLRGKHLEAGIYATAYRCCTEAKTSRPDFIDCPGSANGGLVKDFFRSSLGPSPVTSSSVMIPKRVLDEVGGFPVGVRMGGDLHTWVRIALRYRVAWSPFDGAVYHLSADNRACSLGMIAPDIVFAPVIEEFLQSVQQPVVPRRSVEEYLVSWRLQLALNCCLQGKRSWALSMLHKTRSTTFFRSRRIFLQCIVWLPPALLRSSLRAKALLNPRFAGRSRRSSSETLATCQPV